MVVLTGLLAGCGMLAPAPTPEPPARVLVDLGVIEDGMPIPAWGMDELPDGTAIVVVDVGDDDGQTLHHVAWDADAERWDQLGSVERSLLPDGEEAALRRVRIGPDDGLGGELLLLVGRIPGESVSQVALTVDGQPDAIAVSSEEPLVVAAFPTGTEIDDGYATMGPGGERFGFGNLLPDE